MGSNRLERKPSVGDLIRGGGIALVGTNSFGIYLILRDYVWRSSTKGLLDLRDAWKQQELTASLSLGRLGILSGLSRNSVRRALSNLEEIGWIELFKSESKTRIYRLGRVEDRVEVYLSEVGGGPQLTQKKPEGSILHPTERGPNLTPPRGELRTPGGCATDPSMGCATDPLTLNLNSERKLLTKQRSNRPIRKVLKRSGIRAEGPTQNPTPLPLAPEPANGARKLTPEEARHLKSALAKKADDRVGDYTGREVVAAWRAEYHRIFEVEDVDLRTKTARTRAARTIETRSGGWFEGDRTALITYLRASLRWWKRRKDDRESFPAALPSLEQLFEQKAGGRASWFFKHWQSGGMKPPAGR